MQISSRAAVVAAFGVGPLLLLAGCGGSTTNAGPDATLARIQPTSFVELPPVTTTTTTSLPIDGAGGGIATGEQMYVVQANDGASRIASLHGITMDQLFAYNEWPEGRSHVFQVGEQVRIPPGGEIPGTPVQSADSGTGSTGDTSPPADAGTTTDTAAPAGDGCPTTYTIKSGDNTRIGVANQFGISYEQMDAANANTPGYASFVVGTQITIPCP
ncbi:MAG: LysM domain-containing protein [Ilumatobacteraceae bacterium]